MEVIVTPSAYSNTMADTIADLEEEVFIGTAASANYLAKKGLLLARLKENLKDSV